VTDLLNQAERFDSPPIKALIAPHAGYIYSGPIAASVYQALEPQAASITRVVLLGPSHHVGFQGLATSSAAQFLTPLGAVELDREAIDSILDLSPVHELDEAHAHEHSLEVQLPFLQQVLKDFRLVPIVVGDAAAEPVAEVVERLWGGPETLFVISSDLSHYLPYETARERDRDTSDAIVNLRPEQIQYHDACGRNPVNGLLVKLDCFFVFTLPAINKTQIVIRPGIIWLQLNHAPVGSNGFIISFQGPVKITQAVPG